VKYIFLYNDNNGLVFIVADGRIEYCVYDDVTGKKYHCCRNICIVNTIKKCQNSIN